jgi:hypothetical protein
MYVSPSASVVHGPEPVLVVLPLLAVTLLLLVEAPLDAVAVAPPAPPPDPLDVLSPPDPLDVLAPLLPPLTVIS